MAHRESSLARPPNRRERILRTAVELFHRRGIANANVQTIAAEAGIRAPSLYHHFRDKQAIVDAVVELADAELDSRTERGLAAGTNAAETLGAVIDELVEYVTVNLPLAAVGRHDRALASPEVRRAAEEREAQLLESLAELIGRARPALASGECRGLAHGLIGVVWSVTHSDLKLSRDDLRAYLRRAGRALVLGRRNVRLSRAGRRRRHRRGAA